MKTLNPKKIEKVVNVQRTKRSAVTIPALKEFINLQRNYKKVILSRLYKGAELLEIRKQLESGKITMQWYGQPFPKEILVIEHDILQNMYYDLKIEEESLKNSLKTRGFKQPDFKLLLDVGQFKRELPKKVNFSYIG